MRSLCMALLAVLAASSVQAQTSDLARRVLPGPASVVLEVGRWIVQGREQVYEVTVQGLGRNQDEAQDQALRLAVKQAIGATILSETTVDRVQQELRGAHLVNHSSGIVDRFEVLRTGSDAQGRVTMDLRVWVRRSRLADGLFGTQTNTTQIQGPQIAATLDSESRQRDSSGALIQAGLVGFPERAFQVKVRRYSWQSAGGSVAHLAVDLDLEWQRDWFSRFYGAVEGANGIDSKNDCYYDLSQCRQRGYNFVVLRLRPGGHGAKYVAAWTDSRNYRVIEQALMAQGLSLRVDLMAQGRRVHRQCFTSDNTRGKQSVNQWFNFMTFDAAERRFPWDPDQVGLHVWYSNLTQVSLSLNNLGTDTIKQVDNMEITVIRTGNCA